MTSRTVRRLAPAGAMVLAAGGLVAVTGAPAQAAPDCHPYKTLTYFSQTASILATNDMVCYSTEDEYPGAVSIERQDPVSGAWVTLIYSSTGTAEYHCNGTASRLYRTGTSIFDKYLTAPCG